MSARVEGSVYKRGRVLWVWYFAPDGERVFESTGQADKRAAQSFLAGRRREITDGTWTHPRGRSGPAAAPTTFREHADAWIERRHRDGVRTVANEATFLKLHVYPAIGDLPLAEVRRPHVRDLISDLQRKVSTRTGKLLSSRTVLHVYRTLTAVFADAIRDEKLSGTPCTLAVRAGELPRKRDKDPKWRASAVYAREEAERLLSDPRIAADRRTLYALMMLAGLRGNEAAGRRWRDLESAVPLARLTVATQADGARGDRDTKTGDVRAVPVIPALASILADWREGFVVLFGRAPTPDDPIVPSRADRSGRSFRSGGGVYETLRDDLARIEMRSVPSPRHAMRATFTTMLENEGANMGIARRATHAAPSDVVGGYIRTSWADLCREVGKLQINVTSPASTSDSPCDSERECPAFAVGDTGSEPASSRARAGDRCRTRQGVGRDQRSRGHGAVARCARHRARAA